MTKPQLVVPAIAQTLDIKEIAEHPLLELLKGSLHWKQVLLLLDNFEQVVDAAVNVIELLTTCPQIKVLVTSRAALHVRGEQEFAVPPLAVPDPKHLPDLVTLSQYEAVALFIQRAQSVKLEFQMTNTNALAIAEICIRLDGLPLAIELAAARIKVLPPQSLLARLGQRLAVLTGGARDAPARQKTLRNTIEWSYQLLDVEERRLFRRLSVFAGGCTFEAIEAVCTALDTDSPAEQVLDGVASLIDKSLLQQTEQVEARLMMLETIREFGLECLRKSGEMEATWQAHAEYYLALAEEAEAELGGPQQVAWLERLGREHDNLRAAMRWTLEQWEIWHHREIALRLGGALRRFWEVRGHWSEGWIFLERALAGRKGVAVHVQLKALKAAAHLAFVKSDNDRAAALSEECLARCREIGDTAGIALSLRLLGSLAWRRYNFVVAYSLNEESLTLYREVRDKEGIAWVLNNSAVLVGQQGEYAKAISLNEESLALFRDLGHIEGIAWALFGLANALFLSQGDPAKVHTLLEENLALCREMGHKEGIAQALGLLSQVFLRQGDAIKARSLLEESMVLSRELGIRSVAWLPIVLGKVVSSEGDFAAARAIYEESLAIALEGGDKINTVDYLEGLAATLVTQEEPVWAVRLWGTAESLRDAIGMPLPPVYRADYEYAVATARAQLGEKAFATAWAEGRAMKPEQVLAAPGRAEVSTLISTGQPLKTTVRSSPTYPAGLTAREVEVLRLVAQGLTDAQVAEQLVISSRTVNSHLTSIYNKLGVDSRTAASRFAIEQRLV